MVALAQAIQRPINRFARKVSRSAGVPFWVPAAHEIGPRGQGSAISYASCGSSCSRFAGTASRVSRRWWKTGKQILGETTEVLAVHVAIIVRVKHRVVAGVA